MDAVVWLLLSAFLIGVPWIVLEQRKVILWKEKIHKKLDAIDYRLTVTADHLGVIADQLLNRGSIRKKKR